MTQEKPISLKHLLLRLADAPIMADQTLVRRRVSRLAGMDVGRIRTWTRPAELTRLYKLASRLPEGATVLEVGSYLGASTCYLAAALKRINGTLFCVDTWENQTMPEGEQDTMQRFRDHTRAFTDTIRTIRKRSEHLTISDVTMPVAMVFLDGDHSFEATQSDFNLVAPWVAEGGIVAFHDAVGTPYRGVEQVVGAALLSGQWRIGGQATTLFWITRAQ